MVESARIDKMLPVGGSAHQDFGSLNWENELYSPDHIDRLLGK